MSEPTASVPSPIRQRGLSLLRVVAHRTLAAFVTIGFVMAGLGSGAAFAYFIHGSGSGTGTASTAAAKEITVDKQDVSGLYPGASSNLVITVHNPYSNSALTIQGVTAGNGSISVSGGSGGCTAGNSGVSLNSAASFSPSTVPAGATTAVTFTGAVKMDSVTNFSGCQGAVFAVPVAVNVKVG